MPGAARRVLEADAELARTRLEFLTSGTTELGGVRASIMSSWWRSRSAAVPADELELRYVRDPNLDTPLIRSAEPVLRHLHDQLDGQSLAIVLTDASGVVLSRLTGDDALERQLDRVRLAPGFSYAEDLVGTNGIGTALEAGRPMHVFGHEHYAEHLEELACAGVPVRHPVTGKTVGVLDLTCWRRDAGPLLVTLAKTTAEQIRQALLTEAGVREMELLHEYLRACHRSSGMVFALNNDVVMMNDTARSELSPGDQAALLRHAAEALAERRESSTVELPTGTRVRMHTHPVRGDAGPAGGVVDVRFAETGGPVEDAPPTAPPGGAGGGMLLPGVVGTGVLWRRACAEVEAACRSGEWVAVEGERGVGKLALLRGVHQRLDPAGRFSVLDGREARDGRWLVHARQVLQATGGTVVLRHLEGLDPPTLRALSAALQDAVAARRAWAAVCVSTEEPTGELAGLVRAFPSTVRVPPLRHHVEDVEQLVPFLLRRIVHGKLTCSPEAMQLMLRAQWPGNVEQLLQVLRTVTRHRRSGTIVATDLPSEIGTVSRRRLSPLEAMERDAIVVGLAEAHGNKTLAAQGLGMSRATIYRKIHEYGIAAPRT